jgi:NAD(P)H dehydrogenase (quinone)
MLKLVNALIIVILCNCLDAQVTGSSNLKLNAGQDKTTVLIVYYSETGNTEKLAQAVAAGAQRLESVTTLLKTPDTVTGDDLKSADAIILGSPTYWGNMAGKMKLFIDDWWFKYKVPLVNKVGAAFSTGGGEFGGKENVIYSLVIAMMNAGMIMVGPLEGSSLGAAGVAAQAPLSEAAIKAAGTLGERAATFAQQLKRNK